MENAPITPVSMPEISILFEDEGLVVIDKPPGIVVNRAVSVYEKTLQDWAEQQPWYGKWDPSKVDQELQDIYKERSGVAHRLDKDTSGAMLIAKDPVTLAALMTQFREHTTEKSYLALVHAKFSTPKGTVNLPLGRAPGNHAKFTVDPSGKESETEYEVIEYYPKSPSSLYEKKTKPYQGFSLLRLRPKTGRTHQIRVHMAYIKHPLVGDLKYVGKKREKVDAQWCKRQFLHAEKLVFTNPKDGKRVVINSELPQDLKTCLDLLV